MDGPSRLPHPDRMHLGVSLEGRPERSLCSQLLPPLSYCFFTSMPLSGDPVDTGATCDFIREAQIVHDVEYPGEDGVLAIALDDAFLVTVGNLDGFVRGKQPRTEPGAFGPGGQAPRPEHASWQFPR